MASNCLMQWCTSSFLSTHLHEHICMDPIGQHKACDYQHALCTFIILCTLVCSSLSNILYSHASTFTSLVTNLIKLSCTYDVKQHYICIYVSHTVLQTKLKFWINKYCTLHGYTQKLNWLQQKFRRFLLVWKTEYIIMKRRSQCYSYLTVYLTVHYFCWFYRITSLKVHYTPCRRTSIYLNQTQKPMANVQSS